MLDLIHTIPNSSSLIWPSMDTSLVGDSLAPLAALVLLVLLIPLIYPLGVLIAKYFYFKDKSEKIL